MLRAEYAGLDWTRRIMSDQTITPDDLRREQAEAMKEAGRDGLQQQVYDRARQFGWRAYHTWDSRRSAPGFPDLILLRNERIIAAELKRQNAGPRPEQREWLQAFEDAGAEVYVWRPMDLLDQTIDFVLA